MVADPALEGKVRAASRIVDSAGVVIAGGGALHFQLSQS